MSQYIRTSLYPQARSLLRYPSSKCISKHFSQVHTTTTQKHSTSTPPTHLSFTSYTRLTTQLCTPMRFSTTPHSRRYSTQQTSSATVDLACSAVAPGGSVNVQPDLSNVLILHGLFGSGNNWRNMSRKLSDAVSSNVYLMDLRNHGTSPHSPDMDYTIMAEDVRAFIIKHNLQNVSVIGHSMGGKVAMVLALKYPELVKRLLVVDINIFAAQKTFQGFSTAMTELDLDSLKSRNEADAALKSAVPDTNVRQFLLTNLTTSGDKYKWKCNLPVLHTSMVKLMDFPELHTTYAKPTLFVGGANSHYIAEKHYPTINQLFPNARIMHLEGAGHWVHAEKPQEFLEEATQFLNN